MRRYQSSAPGAFLGAVLLAACGGGGETVTCGQGTTNKDNVCVADPQTPPPAQPVALEDVTVSYLRVDHDPARPLHAGKVMRLELGVTSKGLPARTNVTVGFMERPKDNASNAELAGLTRCVLRGLDLDLHGKGAEQIFKEELPIPHECLPDNKERVFNLFVAIDALVGATSEADDAIVFNKRELASAAVQACRTGLDPGSARGCAYDITVKPSPGLDIEVDSFEPQSAVALLWPPGDHPDVPVGQDEHNRPALTVSLGIQAFGNEPGTTDAAKLPAPAKVRYDLLPVGRTEGWSPLTIESTTASSEAHVAELEVATIAPHQPLHLTHDLFIEGATQTLLKAGGAWERYDTFHVRACVVTTFPEVGDHEDGEDGKGDNCKVVEVRLVRPAPTARIANAYSFDATWSKTFGSTSSLALDFDAGTSNAVNLSGATSSTSLKGTLSGILGTYSLVNAYAQAAAYVSLVDSYARIGVDVFGVNAYNLERKVSTITYKMDWSVAKQKCVDYTVTLGPVPVTAGVCVTGTMGLDADLNVFARTGAGTGVFGSATKIGEAKASARPYANLSGTITAAVNALVARAGAEGMITVMNASAPLVGTLDWGLTRLDPVRLTMVGNATWSLTLSALDGSLSLFADLRSVDVCKKWGIPYPCGISWNRVGTVTLAQFSGVSKTYPLLARQQSLDLE